MYLIIDDEVNLLEGVDKVRKRHSRIKKGHIKKAIYSCREYLHCILII